MKDVKSLLDEIEELNAKVQALDARATNTEKASALEQFSHTKQQLAGRLRELATADLQQARTFRERVDEKLENADAIVAYWEARLAKADEPLTVEVGRRMQWQAFRHSKVVVDIRGNAPASSHPLAEEISLMRLSPTLILPHGWTRETSRRTPETIMVPAHPRANDPTSNPIG